MSSRLPRAGDDVAPQISPFCTAQLGPPRNRNPRRTADSARGHQQHCCVVGNAVAGQATRCGNGFSRSPAAITRAPLRCLRPCSGLVLLDDVGRDTAAVLDLDALPLGPLADLGGVDGGAASPAAGRAPARAAGPPGMREVLLQRVAQLVAVRGAEVDLVFRAVEAEA